MTTHEIGIVDVFADEALHGNALPVVADADTLTREERRAIARELNQPETTLVAEAARSGADFRQQLGDRLLDVRVERAGPCGPEIVLPRRRRTGPTGTHR